MKKRKSEKKNIDLSHVCPPIRKSQKHQMQKDGEKEILHKGCACID